MQRATTRCARRLTEPRWLPLPLILPPAHPHDHSHPKNFWKKNRRRIGFFFLCVLGEGMPYRSWFVDATGMDTAVAVSNMAQVGAFGVLAYIFAERYAPQMGLKVPSI